jgi:hypothetical protein
MFVLFRPLPALDFHRQIHPLLDELLQPSVVGHLLPHRSDLIRSDEQAAALAPPALAELAVGTVLPGVLLILAVAPRGAADVVLFADTARVQGPELGKFAFDLGNTVFEV